MRVRMRAQVTGLRDGRRWPKRGEEADLPKADAEWAVRRGLAEKVSQPKAAKRSVKKETATAGAPEDATDDV